MGNVSLVDCQTSGATFMTTGICAQLGYWKLLCICEANHFLVKNASDCFPSLFKLLLILGVRCFDLQIKYSTFHVYLSGSLCYPLTGIRYHSAHSITTYAKFTSQNEEKSIIKVLSRLYT